VRRLLIQHVLPFVFCLIPLLAAGLVGAATPAGALNFYLQRIRESHMDWLIIGLGGFMFAMQLFLSWRALHWRGTGFDERPDRWLSNLAQAAEWFPLLGLIGTVTGILETFNELGTRPHVETREIVRLYAPAITATGSGLFMALINIFPSWVVLLGRDLIVSLGGGATQERGETRP
jgi:MotA/TolQ/ExbB proton channel family